MGRIIALALEYRFFVFFVTVLAIVAGVVALQQLPIDAVPDITPNQVLVLSKAPGLSPLEVEQSVSKNGLSYVAIYFREDVDTYFARRLVSERLPQVRELIPEGIGTPEMGPISTGLGEIYQFKVAGPGFSPMELRTVL